MQVAQTAACNRLHEIGQRLARWLLMAQDRVDHGTLPITHDFLATMLGTDRPSVSLAAGGLQKNVEIVNRKRLETFACECYRVIQQLNGFFRSLCAAVPLTASVEWVSSAGGSQARRDSALYLCRLRLTAVILA